MQQLRFAAFLAIVCGVMIWQMKRVNEAEAARKQRAAAAALAAAQQPPKINVVVAEKPAGKEAPQRPAPPRKTAMLGDGKERGAFRMAAKLTSVGAGIQELTLLPDAGGTLRQPFTLLAAGDVPSFALDLARADERLSTAAWELLEGKDAKPNSVAFRIVARGGALEIVKRFTLEPDSYFVKLDVEFRNAGAAALDNIAYGLSAGQNLPIEGRWYTQYQRRFAALKVAPDGRSSADEQMALAIDQNNSPPVKDIGIQFAGVAVQYFASVVAQAAPAATEPRIVQAKGIPAPPTLEDNPAKEGKEFSNISAVVDIQPFRLEPGAAAKHEFLLFNGPKQPQILAAGPGAALELDKLISYQSFLGMRFDFISKLLMGILDRLHAVVGNYGIAIMMLTVIVRICLFPISLKQARTMARMQEKMAVIQPKVDELKKKHAGDPQKLNTEMMALYRQHNFSPFSSMGGCLLAFVQLPIFVGLYQGMASHFDLRGQPFFGTWIADLAAPDQFANLPFSLPFLGDKLNILPLIWLALLVWQILTMPISPAATPEQRAQQKAMQWPMIIMMTIMGIGFQNKLPAGLCVYFVVSLTWSFFERKFLPKAAAPAAPPAGAAETNGSAPRNESAWKVEAEPKKSKGKR